MEPTNLIVLTPTYRGPTKEWRETCQRLFSRPEIRMMGIVDEFGNADVADARNTVATKAYEMIARLEAGGISTHAVLWLDDDMAATADVVVRHLAALREAAALHRVHALGGWYVQRGDMHRLAALRGDGPTRELTLDGRPYPSVPLWTGLGCLAMTAAEFVRMVEAAPLGEPNEHGFRKRLVTAPYRKRLTDSWRWVPEDFAWCELVEGGVWSAPPEVRYGHVCSVNVTPDEASVDAILSAEETTA